MSLAESRAKGYADLLAEIAELHARRSPRSHQLDQEARRYLVDGGSHTLRLVRPLPPRIVAARGAWMRDEDGHDILDFWQGHLGNVLGTNPELVTAELAHALAGGSGLQTGAVDRLEMEVAELLCRQTGAERVRFTTSGTLANVYAVMLAQAWTGRDLVMKVGGGWHGGHPQGLKGVHYRDGFDHPDSAGIPREILDRLVVTRFNDPERLGEDFRRHGDRLACFTVEPMLGAGGMIPASREYLRTARELADQHGVLLVFDEVITGFRFRAGDAGRMFGVRPDLMVFGKAIGGGMPVAALAGRADVLEQAGRGGRVAFSGGTYSCHPASLLAARTALRHLVEKSDEIYPHLGRIGAELRREIESAFAAEGNPGPLHRAPGRGARRQLAFLHPLPLPGRHDPRLAGRGVRSGPLRRPAGPRGAGGSAPARGRAADSRPWRRLHGARRARGRGDGRGLPARRAPHQALPLAPQFSFSFSSQASWTSDQSPIASGMRSPGREM